MIFRRPTDTFLLSEQIKKNKSKKFYQEFRKVFRFQSDINPNLLEELDDDLKAFLKQLEGLVFEPVSELENNQFEDKFNSNIFKNFKDLNQQITTASQIGISLNWDNFFPTSIAKPSTSLYVYLQEHKEIIVKFYNFLTNFINKDQLLRLLSAIINISPEMLEGDATSLLTLGIANTSGEYEYTPISALYVSSKLNSSGYLTEPLLKEDQTTDLAKVFMNGFISFSTKLLWFNIFAFEMGKVIHAFFVLMALNINWFGKKMDANNFNELLATPNAYFFLAKKQDLNSEFKHILAYVPNFLSLATGFNSELYRMIFAELEQKGFKFDGPNNEDKKTLACLVALPSMYGRINHLEVYQRIMGKPEAELEPAGEYFAEAFAYWVLTPSTERNFYWGILNKFFKKYFFHFKR